MAPRHARYAMIIGLAVTVLPACEDDPLLPPFEREPDDGGSYGVMMFDLEAPEADSVSADSSRADGDRSRNENPRLF